MAQINKSSEYFNTVLYTGDNSSNRGITGVGFQPDLVWNKTRNQAFNHYIFDSVRGAGEMISSDLTNAEASYTSEFLSFDSDGFSVTQDGGSLGINWSSANYANWCWLGSNTTASNTDGSITSTVSANTTSGFSIVSYTGTGANATVGHGLGAVPKMIIIKDLGITNNWQVYHASIGNTKWLELNTTSAEQTNVSRWNNTSPTSSVFTVGITGSVNGSGGTYIAYCFAEKKGFSKFGSYTGNGNADGTFVYTGFRPAFVMIKRTDSADWWGMFDNKREGYNETNDPLFANTSDAESTLAMDILSNGFKCRNTNGGVNGSGGSYIYMCFAENPLTGTNGVPCTAR